jgi:hypothetical protein
MLTTTAVMLGALVWMASPAVAAGPPEAPETKPATAETTTTATLNGVLNPLASAQAGYFFDYSPEVNCLLPGFSTPLKAEATVKAEKVQANVTELQPDKLYTFCLVATNSEGETPGNEVTFTTQPAAPEILGESTVLPVRASEATLEARINPNNQETSYSFEYSEKEKAGALEGTIVTVPASPGVIPAAFNAAGEPVSAPTEPLAQGTTYFYRVVAENTTGEKATPGKVEQFTTAITPEAPNGLEAKPVGARTATLNGVLNPGAAGDHGSYEFVYQQSATNECEGAQQIATPVTPSSGGRQEAAAAAISGLLPHTTYSFCLLARNEAGEESTLAGPVSFTTLVAPPTIEEEFATNVASMSATLHATLDPQGAETEYVFEYAKEGGPFAAVSEPAGHGSIPEGTTGVPLEVHVQHGLAPSTAYEFWLTASHAGNEQESGTPTDFTTQTTSGSFALPDGRAYEMVSPPKKEGTLIEKKQGIIQAAADGHAITYFSQSPTEAGLGGFDNSSQDLSVREARAGWHTRDLAIPHESSTGAPIAEGPEYRFFSSDLSHAIVQPFGEFTPCETAQGAPQACLSPDASEQTAFVEDTGTGSFTPLVTGCPAQGACAPGVQAHANVPPGTVFGTVQEGGAPRTTCQPGPPCGPRFVAATPDFSHVLLESDVPLLKGAPTGGGLYEYAATGGQLTFIGTGENEAGSNSSANVGAYAGHGPHGISTDGSRIIFRGKSEGLEGLLMRDSARGETVKLGEGEFQTASADDSRVFFDTGWNPELERGVGLAGATGQLEVFEVTSGAGEPLAGTVTQLTGGEGGIRGLVLGASEDGSYVYFVSDAVLPGSGASTPGTCKHANAGTGEFEGTCNLYVDHYDGSGWKPTFIAALPSQDANDWGRDGEAEEWGHARLEYQPTRVSPDGRWLAFMSQTALTGYDTRDAHTGAPDAQVYLYHAAAGGGAPSLTCVSCDPTGARPVGVEYEKISKGVAGSFRAWPEDALVAANLPGSYWDREAPLATSYQPRYLSDTGRLFFNSGDALVPEDVNGTEDVYEFEPAGVPAGSFACSAASASSSDVFEPARSFEVEGRAGESAAGCVALISSGNSSEESAFLDASEGDGEGEHGSPGQEAGADVFFLTTAQLAPQDKDTAYDVYDAHECTAGSPCISPPAEQLPGCAGEASCRPSTPGPSPSGPPSSSTFSGPGNLAAPAPPPAKPAVKPLTRAQKLALALKACRKKHNKGKRQACERAAHKAYGAKASAKKSSKAKRATSDRRASR